MTHAYEKLPPKQDKSMFLESLHVRAIYTRQKSRIFKVLEPKRRKLFTFPSPQEVRPYNSHIVTGLRLKKEYQTFKLTHECKFKNTNAFQW